MNILKTIPQTDYSLTYDDVLLVPQRSSIKSRFSNEINLSTKLLPNLELRYPIISANMDTITEHILAISLGKLGGLGIIHRFLSLEQHKEELLKIKKEELYTVACIGVGDSEFKRLEYLEPFELSKAVLIDIAHGHSDSMIEQIKKIKKRYSNLPIIAGNVATYEGVKDLIKAGANCVKIGCGGGSLCSTRINTGNGMPQLSAIYLGVQAINDFCNENNVENRPTLIADGGIKNSGDIVKSLAIGAQAVMLGGLFAGTTETPGEVKVNKELGLVKMFRGMASREAQQDWKGSVSSIEGELTIVPARGSADQIFKGLIAGIRSGMSYQDARNLKELQENAVFVIQTAAGYRESTPHGLLK